VIALIPHADCKQSGHGSARQSRFKIVRIHHRFGTSVVATGADGSDGFRARTVGSHEIGRHTPRLLVILPNRCGCASIQAT
jgi:hypothetical protein